MYITTIMHIYNNAHHIYMSEINYKVFEQIL